MTEELFDVNVFMVLKNVFEEHFKKGKNVLGASDIPYCGRGTIIKKLLDINVETNMKMLMGKIWHFVFQQPKVLSTLLTHINKKLSVTIKLNDIKTEKYDLVEIIPDHFIRLHIDIYTDKYGIEIKTTNIYTRDWIRSLAIYQVAQLNTYLGYFKLPLGFVLKINNRAILSDIKSVKGDAYWARIWNDYGYILPVKFNQEMFDKTKERALLLFKGIDTEDPDLFKDCEFGWECKLCEEAVREICGKKEYKCEQYKKNKKGEAVKCSKKIYEFPHKVTKAFTEEVTCENCTKKRDYERWKYV